MYDISHNNSGDSKFNRRVPQTVSAFSQISLLGVAHINRKSCVRAAGARSHPSVWILTLQVFLLLSGQSPGTRNNYGTNRELIFEYKVGHE